MAAGDKQPIIIIRKKKGGRPAHHGGAWKVAYADFVTAMMAFFLLLWLLNVTTDVQRKGIADYFSPSNISKSSSGAGGMFGGRSLGAPEARISDSSAPGVEMPEAQEPGSPDDVEGTGRTGSEVEASLNRFTEKKLDELQKQREAEEQAKFKEAEAALRQAITDTPELVELAKSLIIDQTQEGLRIQIVDQDNYSMFPSGSAQMYPQTRRLIELVGKAIARLPNKLAISGHTDSAPFSAGSGRDNWDLSAERANASRRVLEASGIADERIQTVVGRAARDPLLVKTPNDAKNRRISIVLLRRSLTEPAIEPHPATVRPTIPPYNPPANRNGQR